MPRCGPSGTRAIAMALHELATNGAKYGALSVPSGHISLTWVHEEVGGPLILRWTERGGPALQAPTRRGFGTRVIELVIGQLQGQARFDWRPEGLVCEITFRA